MRPLVQIWLGLLAVTPSGCVAPRPRTSPFGPDTANVAVASPPIPAEGGGTFHLLWQDDFDRFDRSRWRLMTHSFPTNLAVFSTSNTRFEDGVVYLDLKKAPGDEPFRGVEMLAQSMARPRRPVPRSTGCGFTRGNRRPLLDPPAERL